LNTQHSDYQPNTRFSFFPPAIKHLLILNILVFVALNTPVISLFVFNYGALWPLQTGNFYPWELITYMFLHAGLAHIFFNLFALWLFGQGIENLWGTKRFVVFYFICGVGAALIQLAVSLFVAGQNAPVIGASGAIFGILLAFGMMFPEQYIYLIIPPIPIKAKYFVIIYGGIELFSGVTASEPGIAHFAHLGGMLFGYIMIKYWRYKGELY